MGKNAENVIIFTAHKFYLWACWYLQQMQQLMLELMGSL
jgi:hypothetical protein